MSQPSRCMHRAVHTHARNMRLRSGASAHKPSLRLARRWALATMQQVQTESLKRVASDVARHAGIPRQLPPWCRPRCRTSPQCAWDRPKQGVPGRRAHQPPSRPQQRTACHQLQRAARCTGPQPRTAAVPQHSRSAAPGDIHTCSQRQRAGERGCTGPPAHACSGALQRAALCRARHSSQRL